MLHKIFLNIRRKKEFYIVIFILVLAAFVHAKNMFGFPYYENDEGVYLSQAWSLLTIGKLAPYTYWYDHAPAGWMFLALWLALTKSVFAFGFSLNSGRVFMLLIHLASTFFVLKIGKKLSGNILVGVLAAIIFSFSPLGLYFQRRLLLDNIMIFWVLWAFYVVLGKSRKLSHYILSGVFLGIAILTKENAIFFVPGFLYTIYHGADENLKRFAICKWLIVVGIVVSLYFLYAFLQGELFQSGTLLGGSSPHVSLIQTLKYQYSRKGDFQSGFVQKLLLWIRQDNLLVIIGALSNVFLLFSIFSKRSRKYFGFALLGFFFWVFLIRGGIIIEFYIVPLIPIMSLFIGILVYEFILMLKDFLPKINATFFMILSCFVITVFYFQYSQVSRSFSQNNSGHYLFSNKQTGGQLEAVDWIRAHIDSNKVIIIDNYSYLDLRDTGNISEKAFPNAQWYWKVDQDPAIQAQLGDSPESIDYIASTPQMNGDLKMGISPLTTQAINNAILVKSFNTYGWGVEIWATRYPSKILQRSWEFYKKKFIVDGEHTVDPANHLTTSEGQSYAMLRAVWMNDKKTFDAVWNWTKLHMSNESGTFGWKWGRSENGLDETLDNGTASDGDTDIALALAFASKQWNESTYLNDSRQVLNGIWNTEVKDFQNRTYLVAGDWAQNKDEVVINPSYLSPYAYKIFAEVDQTHDWRALVVSSYDILEKCMAVTLAGQSESVNLPPNWCSLDKSGNISAPKEAGINSTEYSYDAIRTMWRLALDYKWYGDDRAKNLLQTSGLFLANKWNSDGKILVGYTHDGQSWENYDSVLSYATNLANFAIVNKPLADTIYKTKVLDKFYEDFDTNRHYWEDENNYYTQNWAWFGTALYSDNLPNLWNK